jgi:hypothetical protein
VEAKPAMYPINRTELMFLAPISALGLPKPKLTSTVISETEVARANYMIISTDQLQVCVERKDLPSSESKYDRRTRAACDVRSCNIFGAPGR